ncbi:MAG: PilW family protein [Gammaproteobacteria bacterium]
MCRSNGSTLIELMLAMSIGASILIILLTLFSEYQKNAAIQAKLIDAVCKVNTATNAIKAEVHAAGYAGCASLSFIKNPILGNDHELVIKHASWLTVNVMSINEERDVLVVSGKPIIHANTLVVISDCRHAEMAFVAKANAKQGEQRLVLARPLNYPYKAYAELSEFESHRLFVGARGGLYMASNEGRKVELVDGVERVDFKYIQGGQLKEAREINNWSEVSGVDMNLFLQGKHSHSFVVR